MLDRVVVYNDSFFSLSETFIWEQAHLIRNSFDVSLVGNHIENGRHFDVSDLRVHLIDREDPIGLREINLVRRWLRLYTPNNFMEERNLIKYLRWFKPGLVHAHFGYNALKLLPVLKRLGIPLIVSFHGIDASQRIYDQPKYFRRLPGVLDYASCIIVVSSHMLKTLRITERQETKVRMIPYSVDHDYFKAEISGKENNGVLNIVHSGRLVSKKGVPDLIRVFGRLVAQHTNVRLHILGDGDEYRYCTQLARESGVEHLITFYGSQPRERVRELMHAADIFVLNSRVAQNGDMEGTPVSLLEAMSMQRAVVSTHHAGIPDVISHLHNGLLVAEKNNDELLNALLSLTANRDLRIELGANARNTIVERYNKNRLKAQLTDAYNAVLHN